MHSKNSFDLVDQVLLDIMPWVRLKIIFFPAYMPIHHETIENVGKKHVK